MYTIMTHYRKLRKFKILRSYYGYITVNRGRYLVDRKSINIQRQDKKLALEDALNLALEYMAIFPDLEFDIKKGKALGYLPKSRGRPKKNKIPKRVFKKPGRKRRKYVICRYSYGKRVYGDEKPLSESEKTA